MKLLAGEHPGSPADYNMVLNSWNAGAKMLGSVFSTLIINSSSSYTLIGSI